MRTIKFRGKEIKSGKWVYGDFLTNRRPVIEILANNGTYTVNEETVGQFTNLYDKNGKEIYEGDTIRFFHETGRCMGEHICPVIFDNVFSARFAVQISIELIYPFCLEFPAKAVEVIGNIYDNPELLKGGEK